MPQPDERPRSERPCRRQGHVPRHRPLRERRRPDRGAAPHRDGLPAPESVPEIDLRQCGLRAAHPRDEGPPRRPRRAGAPRCCPVGRGEDTPQALGLQPLRRPAAAPLHRARDRRRAGCDPARRARVGARPDLDRRDRGPDARAQARVHARDRHAQHAAGGARCRDDRVLQPRRPRRRDAERHPRRVRLDREDLHASGRRAHRGLRHRSLRMESRSPRSCRNSKPGCRRRETSSSARSARRSTLSPAATRSSQTR